ncbi:MAG: SDR family oxidoreductase [Actinobacteria bacterium]|nr:SDR family oxidoreductase [Actinomycetota bacterium]
MWRNDAGLEGKSVVVTGAAGGIGRAVAKGFAEAGSKVLLVDVPGSPLREVSDLLPGAGHEIYEVDLADISTHASIFAQAQKMAPLVALAHCAAVLRRRVTVDDVTEADWDLQIDVNLKATFFLNRTARDSFKAAGTKGSIINFSSQGWWSGGYGGSVVYAASKGGVVSMTKGLARSFALEGVRVNSVSPGGVDTSMMVDTMSAEALQSFIDLIPMGRLAEPDEMVGAVLFLASEASTFVTGTVVNVSGGQLMY